MASNKIVRFGPIPLGTTAANLINPPSVSGGSGIATAAAATYIVLKHIRIVNRTGAAVTFSLWVGASGASAGGTEFIGSGTSVSSYLDWYGMLRMDVADFLTGLASVGSALTLEGEGEIGVA